MKTVCVLLFAFLILMSGSMVFGQSLRSVVALVKPKMTDEARAGFNKIADSFGSQGYSDLEEYFRGWAQGSHGSGVLLKSPAGPVILVTNRHVASFCTTADVSFRNADGTETLWSDCPVVYTDPQVDIAVIAIPQDQNPRALPLVTVVSEGAEVWSAGYPGLGGRPEWQLAKGNITNASVTIPELGPEKDAVFYQHSASINPGNSGGPLLIGDPIKPESFRVVGINSYSVKNRNNTFFSIPAEKVLEALKRYTEAGQAKINDDSLALASFLNAPEWDKYAFRRFISFRYASSQGWEEFQKAARTMSTKDRSLWYDRFVDSPLDTLSQFLSFRFWQKVRASSDDMTFVDTEKKDGAAPVGTFTLGKQTVHVGWILEGARWKISSTEWPEDAAAVKKEPAETNSDAVPVGMSLALSGVLPQGDSWSTDVGIALRLRSESKFIGSTTLGWQLGFLQDSPGKADFPSSPPVNKYNLIEGGVGTTYYHTWKLGAAGFVAPFAGVDFDLDLAHPILQSSFANAASGTGVGGSPLDSFLFAGALEPRVGVEVSLDDYWSFGASAGLRWYVFGLHGLKSLPFSIFIQSTSLQ